MPGQALERQQPHEEKQLCTGKESGSPSCQWHTWLGGTRLAELSRKVREKERNAYSLHLRKAALRWRLAAGGG